LFARWMARKATYRRSSRCTARPAIGTHECSQAAFCFLAHEGHVIVFDARSNGASDGRPPLTHERWVRDVDELRAALGVETIVLAGHSYSGWTTGRTVNRRRRLCG